MDVIIEVINEHGEIKLYNDLTENEKDEVREKITNKLIESFARDFKTGLPLIG